MQPVNDQESDRMVDIDTMAGEEDGLPRMQTPILTEIMADQGQLSDVADTQDNNPQTIGREIDEIQQSLYPSNPDMRYNNTQTIGQEIDEIMRSLPPSTQPSVGFYEQNPIPQMYRGPASSTNSEVAESPHPFAPLVDSVATGRTVEDVALILPPPEIMVPSPTLPPSAQTPPPPVNNLVSTASSSSQVPLIAVDAIASTIKSSVRVSTSSLNTSASTLNHSLHSPASPFNPPSSTVNNSAQASVPPVSTPASTASPSGTETKLSFDTSPSTTNSSSHIAQPLIDAPASVHSQEGESHDLFLFEQNIEEGGVMSDAESNHIFNPSSVQSSQDPDWPSVHAYNPFSPHSSPEHEYIILEEQDAIQQTPFPVQAAENGMDFGVDDVEMEVALATMTAIAARYGNEVGTDDHNSTRMPSNAMSDADVGSDYSHSDGFENHFVTSPAAAPDERMQDDAVQSTHTQSTSAVPEDPDEDLIEKIEDAPAPPYASQAIQRADSEPAVRRQEGSGLAPMQQQRAESYRTALEEERASRRQDARRRFRFGRKFRRRREGSGASEDSGRRYTFDNIRRRWVRKFRQGFKKLNDHVKAFVTGRKHRGGSQTSSSQRKDEEMS